MNQTDANPPQITGTNPPPITPPLPAWKPAPPAPDPTELEPITGFIAVLEATLRHPRRVVCQLRQPRAGVLISSLLVAAVIFGLVYGFVVGTFSGGVQYWAAPAKVVAGLMLSAFICLPSLYIFSCLGGSPARLIEVAGLLAGLLALLTLLLLGFAPVAWVFSQSTESLAAMGALHLLFWLVATGFALRFLSAGFAQLGTRSLTGVRVWMAIFLLVMLQMMTALRPIVGTADTLLPTKKLFFVSHWVECLERLGGEKSPGESRTP